MTVFEAPWNPLDAQHAARLRDTVAATRRIGQVLLAQPGEPRISDLREFYWPDPDRLIQAL